ncbi:N-6 DNA methylase [Streptomyces chrestomyceticus]|uniref:N-6 DNA methylase n=1 Tax=Streptomyces chrestomyceticus TaxID=68185 RepID=UPI0036CC8209
MITPQAAVAACTQAAEEFAADTAWETAVQYTVRSLIDRLAALKGLPPSGLEYPQNAAAIAAVDAMGPLEGWHILDLGEIHQRLLELTPVRGADGRVTATRPGLGKRAAQGSWYTPPELAKQMCRFTIGPELDRLSRHPNPENVLQVMAMDPACGAGVFLVEATRLIAERFAMRLYGTAPETAVKAVIPAVLKECIFGVDIDPVAIDLAKAALWLEAEGRVPYDFMDRNVTVGNALDDEMPPAFSELRGEPLDAETRRKEYESRQRYAS